MQPMKPNEVIKCLQFLAPGKQVIDAAIQLIEIAKLTAGGDKQGYIIELSDTDYKEFQKFKSYQKFISNAK